MQSCGPQMFLFCAFNYCCTWKWNGFSGGRELLQTPGLRPGAVLLIAVVPWTGAVREQGQPDGPYRRRDLRSVIAAHLLLSWCVTMLARLCHCDW